MRSKNYKTIFSVIFIIAILLLICNSTSARNGGEAAPYTSEAGWKIHKALSEVPEIEIRPGMTEVDKLIDYIITYKNAYNMAGYDLDKSIIKFNEDIKKDNSFITHRSDLSNALRTIQAIFNTLSQIKETAPDKLPTIISQEAILSLNNIINIIKRQNQIEKDNIHKAEEDSKAHEKNMHFSNIGGIYATKLNPITFNDIVFYLEITPLSQEKIKINLILF